jgi:hypothetical protein
MAKITTVEEVYRKAGLEYSENVEKSSADLKKEIVDRVAANEPGAYESYQRIVVKEADSRVRIAKAEVAAVMDEFDDLLARDVLKAGESSAARENRIWSSHPELQERLTKAQGFLNDLRR